MNADPIDHNIEARMARKLALRFQGKGTLGIGEEDAEPAMDRTQMLAANRTALANMHKSHYMNMEWKPVSRKRVMGRPIVFIKRLIRKSIRWYVKPPILQQNEFNRNSLEVIANLQVLVVQQQDAIASLQEQQAKMARLLQEQTALFNQALTKLHRDVDVYQPYLDMLLEWKTETDAMLDRMIPDRSEDA